MYLAYRQHATPFIVIVARPLTFLNRLANLMSSDVIRVRYGQSLGFGL